MSRRLILALACLVVAAAAMADDVGISSARLIEESPGVYLVEVDATPALAPAFRPPIFPTRFVTVGEPESEKVGAGLQIRYRFQATDQPLITGEALLLPWSRTRIALTVRWADGEVRQGLFARGPTGIRVPVAVLREVSRTRPEVVAGQVAIGATHGLTSWAQWLLMLALTLAAGRGGFKALFWLAGGHALALVITDLGPFAVPLDLAEISVFLAALVLARQALLVPESRGRVGPLLLIVGAVHGAAYATVVPADRLAALLGFSMGTLALAAGQLAVLAVLARRWDREPLRAALGVATGGVAVAVVLVSLLHGSVGAESLRAANPPDLAAFVMPDVAPVGTSGRPAPPRTLEDPVAVFMTIEPYEVRLEYLVRVSDLAGLGDTVTVVAQQPLVNQLLDVFERGAAISVDNVDSAPAQRRGDFVTVSAGGVLTRPEPVPELVSDAVIGLTYIHDTLGLPDAVRFRYDLFAAIVPSVPVTWIDPLGSRQQELTPDAPALDWENRLAGLALPAVESVAVKPPRVPVVSLALVAVAVLVWSFRRAARTRARPIVAAALVVATLLYPFVRSPLAGPLSAAWRLSAADAGTVLDDLLTNVYRSFDLRQESAIYDRLALTVAGGQLTDIYLQSRRSLELENRGGARGRVDDVEILEVHGMRGGGSGGLVVDVTWKVSGSVSHFGHTHYRQNRNRAEIILAPIDGIWKIVGIEIIDEQRVL